MFRSAALLRRKLSRRRRRTDEIARKLTELERKGRNDLKAAGTVVFLHHGIWHCAQPNFTDTTRYMFKLRLRPGQEQRGLFNTDGYDDPETRRIVSAFKHNWQGDFARAENVERAKLWRYVCGDDNVDVSFEGVLTRMGL